MTFDGFCGSCGAYIEPGREVIITDEQGKPKVLCPDCAGGGESAVKLNDTADVPATVAFSTHKTSPIER